MVITSVQLQRKPSSSSSYFTKWLNSASLLNPKKETLFLFFFFFFNHNPPNTHVPNQISICPILLFLLCRQLQTLFVSQKPHYYLLLNHHRPHSNFTIYLLLSQMSCFLTCVRFDDSATTATDNNNKPMITGSVSVSGGVTCYTWDDVESLTSNFSTLIGSGGYSSIYLARLSGSNKAALKVHVGSHRLYQVFRSELEILLRLQHPHIVKLLGYCDDSGFHFSNNSVLNQLGQRIHGDSPMFVSNRFFKFWDVYLPV